MIGNEELRKIKKRKDNLKGRKFLFIREEYLMKESRKTFSKYPLKLPHVWPWFMNCQVMIAVGCDKLSRQLFQRIY